MKTLYTIEITATGDILVENCTEAEAMSKIRALYLDDVQNDQYENGYYTLVNQNTGEEEVINSYINS